MFQELVTTHVNSKRPKWTNLWNLMVFYGLSSKCRSLVFFLFSKRFLLQIAVTVLAHCFLYSTVPSVYMKWLAKRCKFCTWIEKEMAWSASDPIHIQLISKAQGKYYLLLVEGIFKGVISWETSCRSSKMTSKSVYGHAVFRVVRFDSGGCRAALQGCTE